MDVGSTSETSIEREEEVIKDKSPDGRYCHYGEKLGSGAFKTVYMAFDRETGTQLAWNQIVLNHDIGEEEFKRIYKEISILKQIEHPSIIQLYDSWIDEEKGNLIFITEAMTSGTLAQFRKRIPSVSLTVVQNWARQLLSGLDYLHTRDPVIMHRDIKANNIFMDATTEANRVKIGDLGLATLYTGNLRAEQMSVIGTPEYMAPEFYSESYNQLVDIWAFGLVILEMISDKVPYAECKGATAQIFLKVSRGTLPEAFHDLLPGPCQEFIAACLLPASVRPSAAELLQAPFLTQKMEGSTAAVFKPRSADASPSMGRPETPSSLGSKKLKSPRDSDRSVSPSPPIQVTGGGDNTTQNLNRMATSSTTGDHVGESRDASEPAAPTGVPPLSVIAPVPVNAMSNKSEPSSPHGPSSLTDSGEGLRDDTFTPKLRKGSAEFVMQQKDGNGGGSPEKKFVPLSLTVNSVEGDKMTFLCCVTRKEETGLREKKSDFVFDVSCDEVQGDALGLAEANRPDFNLDVEEVCELLSRRIAENLYRTTTGERLGFLPSMGPSLVGREARPKLGATQSFHTTSHSSFLAPQPKQPQHQSQQQFVHQQQQLHQQQQQQQQQHHQQHPLAMSTPALTGQGQPERRSTLTSSQSALVLPLSSPTPTPPASQPTTSLSVPAANTKEMSSSAPSAAAEPVDIDARRLEMLEKFSLEKNAGGNNSSKEDLNSS